MFECFRGEYEMQRHGGGAQVPHALSRIVELLRFGEVPLRARDGGLLFEVSIGLETKVRQHPTRALFLIFEDAQDRPHRGRESGGSKCGGIVVGPRLFETRCNTNDSGEHLPTHASREEGLREQHEGCGFAGKNRRQVRRRTKQAPGAIEVGDTSGVRGAAAARANGSAAAPSIVDADWTL